MIWKVIHGEYGTSTYETFKYKCEKNCYSDDWLVVARCSLFFGVNARNEATNAIDRVYILSHIIFIERGWNDF